MQIMDMDKFIEMLEKDPNLIEHELVPFDNGVAKRLVLTASTKELQEFTIKYANDTNLFGDATNLVRVKKTEPAALVQCDPNEPKTDSK